MKVEELTEIRFKKNKRDSERSEKEFRCCYKGSGESF